MSGARFYFVVVRQGPRIGRLYWAHGAQWVTDRRDAFQIGNRPAAWQFARAARGAR